jgi:hypothetical protein
MTQAQPKFWINIGGSGGGTKLALSRVPWLPGIYAWYAAIDIQALRFLSENEPDQLAEKIYKLTTAKHCSDRTGVIPPSYSITLRSSRELPSQKLQQLKQACKDSVFRSDLLSAMEKAVEHFQQPLYVGKARILRARIESHLLGRTPLKERLFQAGIDIERCRLLLLPSESLEQSVSPLEAEDPDARLLLVEDILSRIFQPPFTLRYG